MFVIRTLDFRQGREGGRFDLKGCSNDYNNLRGLQVWVCYWRLGSSLVPAVRRQLQVLTLCFAWLCANGALWDAVQVVAWGKMIRDYSQIMSFTQAVQKTFDGSGACEICAVVDDVKASTPAQQVERSHERVLLALHTPEKFMMNAPAFTWPGVVHDFGLTPTDPVPVRPPRC